MRLRRYWRFAAVAVVVVGVAAFLLLRGGDDEGPELTPAAFVEDANAICANLAEKNLDLPPPPVPYGSISEDFFQSFNDNVTEARDRFDELNAPAASDQALDDLVAVLGLVETRAQQASAAASVDQSPEVDALVEEIGELSTQAAELEQRLAICPGRSSFRISIGTVIRRKGENPLTETGTLG
jgi:hypothetical protein